MSMAAVVAAGSPSCMEEARVSNSIAISRYRKSRTAGRGGTNKKSGNTTHYHNSGGGCMELCAV